MALWRSLLEAMRPRQWIKNLLVFAGIFYAGKLSDIPSLLRAVAAFLLFCAISGTIYIVNDILDLEQDRHHPKKRLRPIASGRLPLRVAGVAAIVVGVSALVLSFVLSIPFGFCALAYAFMMSAYSLRLKQVVILDILILSIGFVLRAYAGTLAVVVEATPWFLACVLFLALFISICKRRHELLLLNERAKDHRAVLRDYSPAFLDQMVSVSTAASLLSYTLWTVSTQTQAQIHPEFRGMIITVPFVVYGIFRYLFLVYHRSEGGAPEVMFLTDRSLLINTILWLAVVMILIYYHRLLEWLPIAG
jgi:4-hydroxybenzoate polyprenyltransferase